VQTLTHVDDELCRRFQASIEFIGKRWTGGIMMAIREGADRFSEIGATVTGLSDRLLAQRLKELEAADMIERVVVATTPVQVRYRLTERGIDLMDSLQPVVMWDQRWN